MFDPKSGFCCQWRELPDGTSIYMLSLVASRWSYVSSYAPGVVTRASRPKLEAHAKRQARMRAPREELAFFEAKSA